MATEETTSSILDNVKGLDHFDPFQGFVDDNETLNIRYGFRLGNINFLINQFSMSEVVIKPVIYSIPNTPSWIQGLINLRGILVPVFNLKRYLGLESETNKNDTLLVIDKGERAFATFIEKLPDSINVDEVELTPVTVPDDVPKVIKGYITETYKLNDETWFELNYDSFIKNMTKEYSDNESD